MDRPARLTADYVEKLDEPGRYTDGEGGNGLNLLVRPRKDGALAKNWAQHIKVQGKARSLGLGTYPDVKLVEARRLAADNATRIRAAFPPKRARGIERLLAEAPGQQSVQVATVAPPLISSYPTFSAVAGDALEHLSAKWKGDTTRNQRQRLSLKHIDPVIGTKLVDQVSSEDIMRVLAPIWNVTQATATKVLLSLQSTINYAIGMGYITEDPIPRAKIDLGRQTVSTEHHEALPYDQATELWQYARSVESNTSLCLQLLFLTAVRSGEARGAVWAEVDFGKEVWTIPGERMKEGHEHRVPLSAAALDVLRRAKDARDGRIWPDDLIFPNSGWKPMTRETLVRFVQKAFKGVVVHGLRTTFDMWASETTEYPAEIVNHALAHLEGSATIRAYRRTDYFEKRRALMRDWARYVTEG